MNNERAFEQIIEEALQLQSSGASKDVVLSRFPEFSADLAPLLDAAALTRKGLMANQTYPVPDLARGREKFLRSARGAAPSSKAKKWFAFSFPQYATAGALAILIVALIGGNAFAALPGDPLYSLKLGFEQVQLGLTFDADANEKLQNELLARRISEVKMVVEKKRETNIGFQGVVESASNGTIIISGVPVKKPAQFDFQPGEIVRIEARTSSDGAIVPVQINRAPTRPPKGPTETRPTQPAAPAPPTTTEIIRTPPSTRPNEPSPLNRTQPPVTPPDERTRPVETPPVGGTTRPTENRPPIPPSSVPPQNTGTRPSPPAPPQTIEPPRSPPLPGERPTDPRGRSPEPRTQEPPPTRR